MKSSYIEDLVSIITPVYNCEEYIEQTIMSVVNQTYKKWELILVNDCSTDNSSEIIKHLSENYSNITIINLNQNSGAAVARNLALKHARGRYIAFLDSDDLWVNNKLEVQLNFMKEKNLGFTFTDYSLIDETGKPYNKLNNIIVVPGRLDYDYLLKNTIILCSSVMIDKNIVGEISIPLIRAGQDTATWLNILKKINYGYGINECLSLYRQRENSISSNKINAIKRTWKLYRETERLSLIKSIYVFVWYAFNAVKKRV